jgi:hypothetical protein
MVSAVNSVLTFQVNGWGKTVVGNRDWLGLGYAVLGK